MQPPPSGNQYEIASGDARATIVEVGGALRTYTVGGRDRVDGYASDEMCSGSRGQVLAPWPNRIADGAYEFDGPQQLALNEPAMHNAIHGLVRWSPWTAAAQGEDRVTMTHTLHPQPGYPFLVGFEIEYSLGDEGLHVRASAANLGETACPLGLGFHPYLRLDTARIDALELESPAATYLTSDDCKIPTGSEPVAGTAFDFRSPRTIGSTQMDHAFTDLKRDAEGRATLTLRDRATGESVALWCDASYGYLMVFTGDALPEPDRRRTGLAVEPMTCAPNAFRTGDGLRVLDPGSTLSAAWGIRTG